MAEDSTKIDELRLDITVEDKTSGESSDKKVRSLASAISRLDKVINSVDTSKLANVFSNMTSGIKPFVNELKKAGKEINNLAYLSKKVGLNKASNKVAGLQVGTTTVETATAKQTTPQENAIANAIEKTKKSTKSFNISSLFDSKKTRLLKAELFSVQTQLKTSGLSQKAINKLTQQELSLKKKIKDSGKSELVTSIKRVGIYRAIRASIKWIVSASKESVSAMSAYNSELQSSLSTISSDMAKLKASLGVAVYQVLISLEPVITSLTNGIVEMANAFSKVMANLRGVSTYTKINTKYFKEYQSVVNGTLLSFDTFETLSSDNSTDYSQMFETATDALDTADFSETESQLKTVFDSLKQIFDIVKDIFDGLKDAVSWLNDKGLLVPLLTTILGLIIAIKTPIVAIIGSISLVISSMKDLSDASRIAISIVAAVAAGLAAVFTPGGALAKITAAAVTFAGITALLASTQVKAHADGGMFEGTGTMYHLAGEAGAEVVASGSEGTGVTNVNQFADAMVSALVRYGAAREHEDSGSSTSWDSIGANVARSNGFINEFNRRNSSVQIK